MTNFDAFWARYPRKVGKFDAMKAYGKAVKLASPEDILAGVERYKLHKPDYADWCHPATWLNRGRWLDEYEDVKPRTVLRGVDRFRDDPTWVPERDCQHTHKEPCVTRGICQSMQSAERRQREAS